MDALLQDLRFALRTLLKQPGFVAIAALSLAIGIGANTAIFSAVNSLLLEPLPGIDRPDRIVELGRTREGRGFDTFSYPDFLDLREQAGPLEGLAGVRMESMSLSRDGAGERVFGVLVSASYFRVLGVEPALGRLFAPEEDVGIGEHPVAVVSHRFWRNRLGGDPDVVGSTLRLNRHTFTVVGVAAPEFRGHMAGLVPDVWVPIVQYAVLTRSDDTIFQNRGASWFQAIGRLTPGATVDQADAAVKAVVGRLAEAHPRTNARRSARVIPLGPVPGGGRGPVTGFLAVLMGLVGLILVITCVNVAGMFLARATAREKEIAVRLALGSGRGRLVRQLITEGLVVFVLAGAVGVALAAWGVELLSVDALPFPVEVSLDLSPDLRVLAFAAAATLGTGILFGLIPALQATRLDLVPSLKDEALTPGSRGGWLRRILVAGQVTLSLVLLVGAGLFVRSLQRASEIETGFEARGAYTTSIDLSLEGYEDAAEGRAFQERLLEGIRAIPGVEDAALAGDLPLDMTRNSTMAYPEEWEGERSWVNVDFNVASAGYFEALRIPLLRGRTFTAADREEAERVAVVSRTFVREVWPGEEALGRRFRFGGDEAPFVTVVGVVEDVKNQLLTEEARPFVYLPLAQRYRANTSVVVRAPTLSHETSVRSLERTILDQDPSLSMTPVMELRRVTEVGILPQRLAAGLTGALGLLALLLSGIGTYGVVAQAVSRRTREMGIRMALGAGRGRVAREVLASGMWLALPGLVIGAILALGMGHLLRRFILGVSPTDPLTLTVVGAALLGVVFLGSWVPARRAAWISPSEALRSE